MARGKIPRITWGVSFANTIDMAVTFDRSITYSRPRQGSMGREISSGIRDSWNNGFDQILEGTVRRIPIALTGGIRGWDGTVGWRAFLEDVGPKGNAQLFRWIFDVDVPGTFQTMYLLEPVDAPAHFLEGGYQKRGLFLKMRADDDTPITGY